MKLLCAKKNEEITNGQDEQDETRMNWMKPDVRIPLVSKILISLLQDSMCTRNNYFFTTGFHVVEMTTLTRYARPGL